MSHSNQSDERLPTPRIYRIAFCITDLDPGGAERQLVRLATHLDRTVFQPEVICLSGEGELVAALQAAHVPVVCLNAASRWDVRVLYRLWKHFRRTRPDLVQSFLFHANIAGRIAARLAGVRCVVSGIRVAERQKRWHLWIDRLTDALVDRHVCVSRDVAEFSRTSGRLPADKLTVIPNSIDIDAFERTAATDLSEFGFAPTDQVILFVGRLVEQKNPFCLLNAFRRVLSDFPHAKLLFVGTGPLEAELRCQAASLGSQVAFAGHRNDVPGLLKSVTCLALPSRWEGMPNVVLEAMAAGTPVVASAAEGIGELLRDGEFGTCVQSGDPESFAGGLRQVLGNPPAAAEKARLAQTIAMQQHMVSKIVDAYQGVYWRLLSAADALSVVKLSKPDGATF